MVSCVKFSGNLNFEAESNPDTVLNNPIITIFETSISFGFQPSWVILFLISIAFIVFSMSLEDTVPDTY